MFRRKEETTDSATGENGQSSLMTSNESTTSATATPAAPSYAAAPAAPVRQPAAPVGYRSAPPAADYNRQAPRVAAQPSAQTAYAAAPVVEKTVASKSRRVLTVGNDILLKGEIATCDRLVIEGRVEAKLSDVHTVEIAESGSFKGTAEVEDAEISGIFEGDLIVRNRIVIYATGEVRGNISYGEIEIERGGQLTGQIKTVTGAPVSAKSKTFAADSLADAAKVSRSTKESVAA